MTEQSEVSALEALNKWLTNSTIMPLDPMRERARQIAVQAHVDQLRRNGDPYVTHPFRVAEALSTEDEKTVGYLHDVIEDTNVTLDDLRRWGFPERIIQAVDSVTNRDGESYVDFVVRSKKDAIGRNVKLADLRDNMRDSQPGSQRDKYELSEYILLS